MRRLALPLVLIAAPVSAGEPLIFGQRFTTPLFSPPGWYGPGPALHRPTPQYLGWNYYGLSGTPTVTAGITNRGHGFGPGYFGLPGAAGSFWTNGLSLYGPPIPTYATQPGVFGNADLSRAYLYDAPVLPAYGAGLGVAFPGKRHPLQPPLGWFGQYSPSPRGFPSTVNVNAAATLIPGPMAVTTTGQPCINLTVCVPQENAQVWIQHTPMAATGTERAFVSPPLEAGKSYDYELIARWHDAAGKEHADTRQVRLEAGQTARVSFGIEQ